MRRYAFGQQPDVALWNLAMLARALSPLVPNVDELEAGLERYRATFAETQHAMMRRKLGLTPSSAGEDDDRALLADLHQNLTDSQIDMTLFFRQLSHRVPDLVPDPADASPVFRELIAAASYLDPNRPEHDGLLQWLHRYVPRLRREPSPAESIRETMLRANPKYVLRNYLAQNAIDRAETGDLDYLRSLLTVLQRPFDEQPEHSDLAAKRPDWARSKPGCATLSCSS
jgi:uncharacterized protein YdiU (UPF0061 family)